MLSSREVVEQMAFQKSAEPPEPVDGSASTHKSKAFQKQREESLRESDPLLQPSHGYYDDHIPLHSYQGDSSIRPNTGETNSYENALFGRALHELLKDISTANRWLAGTTILLVLVGWIGQILMFQWATAVLSGFLSVGSAFLLFMELFGRDSLWLKDQIGFLYHPVGKSLYLVLILGPLSFGIHNGFLIVTGVGYCVSGLTLGAVWLLYPEFRRQYEDEERVETRPVSFGSSWSYYSGSLSSWRT